MRDTSWGKVGAIAGLLFAVLLVAGAMGSAVPGDTDTDAEVVDYWADGGNQKIQFVVMYLLTAGALALVAFMGTVRSRLVAAGDAGPLPGVAFGSAVVMAGTMVAAGVAWSIIGAQQVVTDEPLAGADVLRMVPAMGYGFLLIGGGISAAVMLGAVSWSTLRTGAFARWIAWLGFVCAVVVLFGVFFVPLVAVPIWALAASFELWRRPAPMAAA